MLLLCSCLGGFGAQTQQGVAQAAVFHGPAWGWGLCGTGQSLSHSSALRGCVSLGLSHTPRVRVHWCGAARLQGPPHCHLVGQAGGLCTAPAALTPEALAVLCLSLWASHGAKMLTAAPGGLLAISLQKYFYTKLF